MYINNLIYFILLLIVHRENMALYQKELILKQQASQNKNNQFFITGKDFDIKDNQQRYQAVSRYAENIMKYPSCNITKVFK